MWNAHTVRGRLELRPTPHVGMWLPFDVHNPHIRVGTRVRCVTGDGTVWWDTRVRAIGLGIQSYHPKDREAWERNVQFELTWGDG